MDSGYIKMYRKFLDWEWYSDINTKVLFLHLLLTANYEDKQWQGITIKRGHLLTSRDSLSKETGLSHQQIRTSLSKLQSTNEITNESTTNYTIIHIQNYELYQSKSTNKQPTNQPTSNEEINQRSEPLQSIKHDSTNQQATNESTNESTTTKEYKNIKEIYKEKSDKNSNDVFPYFLYVFLDLGWKPSESDSLEGMQEWMRKTLKGGGIISASDAKQVLVEFHAYWETRRDEKGFSKKNWKTTLLNSPSLPLNKQKYASAKK